MTLNKEKLERVVETAKAKAAGNARWINAIDKAVEGLLGTWIVTELHDGLMITTENGTYYANGVCQCKAYEFGQACKHRAAARLVEMYNEETAPEAVPSPLAKTEILDAATDVQRRKIEALTTSIRLRGDNYTLSADGKDILVTDSGKISRVDRKGKVTWNDNPEFGLLVRPQPKRVECNGWSI